MKKIWGYEDYLAHLSHENTQVRKWAFHALENHYPNRYADRMHLLIGDEDEYLACMAMKYLAKHQAIQHAPAILKRFENSSGSIASNAAQALAAMNYEAAADSVLERFERIEAGEVFFGLLEYMGKIRSEKCREMLIRFIGDANEYILLGSAIQSLLRHQMPEDIDLVIDSCFALKDFRQRAVRQLRDVADSLGAHIYYRDLAEARKVNIVNNPDEVLEKLLEGNSQLAIHENFRVELTDLLENGMYREFAATIASSAEKLVRERYPKDGVESNLAELFAKDAMCLHLFKHLSGCPFAWELTGKKEGPRVAVISLILAVYLAVVERGNYVEAFLPDAKVEALIRAITNAGYDLPVKIQEKVKDAAPVSELKAALTEELLTWGDVWIVRMMGEIGHGDFGPDLIRVLRETDSLDYIYNDGLGAIQALDESADEMLLAAIKNDELGAWESFPVLEHLAYEEAYDLAWKRWTDKGGDVVGYEIFSNTLQGIGDKRAIEELRKIYNDEDDGSCIGDALECLSMIHGVPVPELPEIRNKRKELEKWRRSRRSLFEEMPQYPDTSFDDDEFEDEVVNVPFKRSEPKVGRNAPCPCGSGKKYKKCCLNKTG